MAVPTVTQISSYTDGQRPNGDNLRPTTAYRITGGTSSDPLTMDEIVADSTISALLSFDPDTGVVKRVGATPTPYTFIFGSGAPQTTIASGSNATVINVADATGFTTTGKVRVNGDGDREREIDSISGNAITLSSALPSSPNNGQRVKFLEDSDNITPDCYIELVGVTFDLHSNAGTDTSAQDLGDETDKIIFSDYCDVTIGSDVGDSGAPDAGNCNIITENFSWNFYNYVEVFQEGTKVTCYGYLKFILKGNSRPSLVNRNTNSIIRVIVAAHSVSPFADNYRCNFDLNVASQEIIMYGGAANFRPNLLPGGVQSDEFVLPAAVAESGGTVYLYWQDSPFATTGYTVRGLQTIREVGTTTQPQVDVQSADGADMLVKLADFGGKRADEFFRFSADDGHLTTEISQKLNFKIRDAGNSAITASRIEVDAGSYAITYSPSDLGTPTISTTDYNENQDFQDVSDQSIEVTSKVFACNEGNNQNFREVSSSSITSTDLSPFRYSIWAWGYEISYQVAFTLDDETGEADLVIVLPEDNLVTVDSIDDVADEADTFDDIYDMLTEYAFNNYEDIACTVENGVLTFTDSNVTFANGGTLSRSSGTLTLPCSNTLAVGDNITRLVISGTATLESGVAITGPYQDTNGIRVIVAGYPAGTRGSVAFWLASQGERDRQNAITAATFEVRTDVRVDGDTSSFITTGGDFRPYGVGSTLITSLFTEPENNGEFTIDSISADGRSCVVSLPNMGRDPIVDEAAGGTVELENGSTTSIVVVLQPDTEYFMVADAVSYLRSSSLRINTGQTTAIQGSLRRIVDAAGNNLIPNADELTDDEMAELALIKYEVGNDIIRFGASNDTNEYSFRSIARAIEVGQSRPEALENEFICIIREGSFSFEADSDRMITRDSGIDDDLVPDLSGFQFTKIGTTDLKDFVDYSNGAIIVNGGVPAVVSVAVDIDSVDISQTTFDERMLAVPNSTKNTYKGTGGGSGTDPLDVVGASIFGSSFKGEWAAGDYAVDDVVWHVDSELFYKCTVVRDSTHTDNPSVDTSSWDVAQVEAGSGGGTSSYSESNLHTHLDNYSNKDDWQADISSIPTSNPTVDDIVAAIQAADFGSGSGTQTLSQQFALFLDIIGSSIFGDDFKGEWAAGDYDEENVVWFSDKFYTCTTARTTTDTDDPATDTSNWRIANGMIYSQVINAYYDPFGT